MAVSLQTEMCRKYKESAKVGLIIPEQWFAAVRGIFFRRFSSHFHQMVSTYLLTNGVPQRCHMEG